MTSIDVKISNEEILQAAKKLNPFNNLCTFEKNKLYDYLGSFTNYLKEYDCFVAGGMVSSLFTNKEINDVDIYFRSEETFIKFVTDIWDSYGAHIVTATDKATLITANNVNIQLIHFGYFKTPEEIFDKFDFTVCMGCFDFKDEQFHFHEEFFKHNSQRILKFNKNTAYPIMSLLRVQKYNKKGYTISKPEMVRIILKCMDTKINTYQELKDQIGGMYGENHDKLMEGLDDETFSLDKVIDNIENLSLSDDYFKKPILVTYDSLDDYIDDVTNLKIDYFVHNESIYRIYGDSIRQTKHKPKGKELDIADALKGKKIYKYVKKEGDRYFSFFDDKFEYKIGEEVIANKSKNSHYGNVDPVLYFVEKKDISYATYKDSDGSVLIEATFNPEDFYARGDSDFRVKKCRVLRVVPEEERKELEKHEDEDEDWG